MRHVAGLFLAVIMALVLFAGAGWGTERIGVLRAAHHSLESRSGGLALAALVGTGLLLGIVLVAPRISPLAAVLPGLGLLAWSAYMVINGSAASRLIPMRGQAVGAGFRALLASGILALIGALLVIPLFVPSRWRRRRPAYYYDGGDDGGYSRPSPEGLLR
jgi:hypothetical protein